MKSEIWYLTFTDIRIWKITDRDRSSAAQFFAFLQPLSLLILSNGHCELKILPLKFVFGIVLCIKLNKVF